MSARPWSVVLGAGLMGRLLAHALATEGHRVEVFEAQQADAQGAAARVAAAMLAPLAESAITELSVVRMGQHALLRWPELIAQLGQPVFFQQNGTLIVWHRQDAPEARRFAQVLAQTQRDCPSLPAAMPLDKAAWPRMSPVWPSALPRPCTCPARASSTTGNCWTLCCTACSNKAWPALGQPRNPDDFKPGTTGQPDWVFDCRGLGARAQWSALRGVRGEVIRLHAPGCNWRARPAWCTRATPSTSPPNPTTCLSLARPKSKPKTCRRPACAPPLELLSAAYTVHPGFGEARILEVATQARPTLADNLPHIRCSGPRSVQINGLYRHGFLIAPAMLDALMEWLHTGQHPMADNWGLRFDTTP
jgi:glycine oxidase